MASTTAKHPVVVKLLRALGLEGKMIRSVSLNMAVGEIASAKVEMLLPEDIGDELIAAFEGYHLEPDDPPSLDRDWSNR